MICFDDISLSQMYTSDEDACMFNKNIFWRVMHVTTISELLKGDTEKMSSKML